MLISFTFDPTTLTIQKIITMFLTLKFPPRRYFIRCLESEIFVNKSKETFTEK